MTTLDPASGKTSALLVEGGGLRGAFSAGVLAELGSPGGLVFDDVLAVSSGAPTAAYLVAGQIDDGIRIWEEHTHGDQLISPRNLLRGRPLMDIDRLVGVFERGVRLEAGRLGEARSRLWIGVTNCRTAEAEYVRVTSGNVFELLRATMALPIAYGRVVPIEGVPYIDGGVADAIPIRRVEAFEHDLTVAVLTRPRGYRRKGGKAAAYVMGRTYAGYPKIGAKLAERSRISNEALDRIDALEDEGKLSVIRPAGPLPAGRLSTKRDAIVATVEAGRAAARAWLKKKGS